MATTDLPSKLGSELERIVLERIASNRLVLPAMPSVPQRCLDILREPDFNVRRLVKELEAEPVLALLVIRAANAASYGRSATLQALDQAVVRLGSRALRTLITEYAVNELFESSNRRLKEANRRVWEHSVVVALLARDIAALIGTVEPDTCYLAGLLHDIGKPVLGAMLLEIDRKLGRATPDWIDLRAWTQIIENSHRKVGVAVATEWKLPDAITAAIRDCSDYDGADRASVGNVVRLSNALAKREGYTTGPIDTADIEALIMVGMSMLGADPSAVDRLVTGIGCRIPGGPG
ncbi:MAG: HDOD domain-containing protein [Deltaproteobacteria bacterium]|nr:MAG: HDOD domain-containing protein [Deltaproteobacteria bacterium]